jgi:hypothetical protein
MAWQKERRRCLEMDILKITIGILVAIAAFTIPSLSLAVRYVKRKKGKDKAEAATDKAEELSLKKIWWEYFKPLAAVPVSWYLYHLIFYLMLPDVARAIWNFHWHYLMALELSVIVLNSIINKDTPFEERTSRKLMVATYVQTFVMVGIIIIFRIGWGETAANLDRATLSMLANSTTELLAENIEKFAKAHRAKSPLEKMDKLLEKAKKLGESDEKTMAEFFSEYEKMEAWKAEAQKEYAVPEEKKIDWRKFWLFGQEAEAQAGPVRQLSGIIYVLPKGIKVTKDINGNEHWHLEGERGNFQQLGPTGQFTVLNKKISSLVIDQPTYTTGPAISDGKVELMATGGKDVIVELKIIPPRS